MRYDRIQLEWCIVLLAMACAARSDPGESRRIEQIFESEFQPARIELLQRSDHTIVVSLFFSGESLRDSSSMVAGLNRVACGVFSSGSTPRTDSLQTLMWYQLDGGAPAPHAYVLVRDDSARNCIR